MLFTTIGKRIYSHKKSKRINRLLKKFPCINGLLEFDFLFYLFPSASVIEFIVRPVSTVEKDTLLAKVTIAPNFTIFIEYTLLANNCTISNRAPYAKCTFGTAVER